MKRTTQFNELNAALSLNNNDRSKVKGFDSIFAIRPFSATILRGYALMLFLCLCVSYLQAATIYVKTTGSDANDGASWANAYASLQTALASAVSGDEIWVAKGTYYPTTSTTDRDASFALKDNVAIYGGFTGNENLLSLRDWRANRTILSGDIDKNNILDAGNSNHVFYMQNYALSSNTILDGFEIAGGYQNDLTQGGGGLSIFNNAFLTEMNPSFVNCTFRDNYAGRGGAVCLFSLPVFTPAGQVIAPSFLNCQFINNSSSSGGAIYAFSGSASSYFSTTRP